MSKVFKMKLSTSFIKTPQKLVKKQTFSPTADPNIVSRQRGILGCGRRPLFTNTL
jgi:hypothetical protein